MTAVCGVSFEVITLLLQLQKLLIPLDMPGYKLSLQGKGEVHEGLKCSYCRLVLKDPIQTSETGQRYCKECYEDARLAVNYAVFTIITVCTSNRTSTSEFTAVIVDTNDMVSRTDTNRGLHEGDFANAAFRLQP